MRTNFINCWCVVKDYEGGLSMIKSDPGNWTGGKVGKGDLKGTKYGISAAAFPNLDIPNLTEAQAMQIYTSLYWNKVDGDDLAAGLDLVTFDYGVNSGVARANADLHAVGQTAKTVTDAIKGLCSKRLSFLQSLKLWNTFKAGWASRVASVEAKGVAMYLAATKSPAEAKATLLAEAHDANKTAATTARIAANVGAGSAVALPAATSLHHPWAWAAVGVALVGVIAAVIIERHKHAARAAAYTEAANAIIEPTVTNSAGVAF